jgi:hypothetical protein
MIVALDRRLPPSAQSVCSLVLQQMEQPGKQMYSWSTALDWLQQVCIKPAFVDKQ